MIRRRARNEAAEAVVGGDEPRRQHLAAAPRRRRPWRRWLSLTAGIAIFALVVAGGLWAWESLLRVRHVEIAGAPAQEAVVRALVDLRGESMFTADLAAPEAEIAALPRVASASIERRWPNTLRVVVIERRAWGSWEQAGQRYTIDREGVVLGDDPAPADSVTIVSNESYALRAGDRVDPQAVEVAAGIGERLPRALGTRAVEVTYAPREGVRVRTATGQTALLGGSSGLDYKFAVWARLHREAAARAIAYSVIDLRFGDRPVLR